MGWFPALAFARRTICFAKSSLRLASACGSLERVSSRTPTTLQPLINSSLNASNSYLFANLYKACMNESTDSPWFCIVIMSFTFVIPSSTPKVVGMSPAISPTEYRKMLTCSVSDLWERPEAVAYLSNLWRHLSSLLEFCWMVLVLVNSVFEEELDFVLPSFWTLKYLYCCHHVESCGRLCYNCHIDWSRQLLWGKQSLLSDQNQWTLNTFSELSFLTYN